MIKKKKSVLAIIFYQPSKPAFSNMLNIFCKHNWPITIRRILQITFSSKVPALSQRPLLCFFPNMCRAQYPNPNRWLEHALRILYFRINKTPMSASVGTQPRQAARLHLSIVSIVSIDSYYCCRRTYWWEIFFLRWSEVTKFISTHSLT